LDLLRVDCERQRHSPEKEFVVLGKFEYSNPRHSLVD
jgi:hypothetical protein